MSHNHNKDPSQQSPPQKPMPVYLKGKAPQPPQMGKPDYTKYQSGPSQEMQKAQQDQAFENQQTRVSVMQKLFGKNQQQQQAQKSKKTIDIPRVNLKGEKVHASAHPETSPGAIERQLYAIDKGPRMLPRKQRFKVWFALIVIGGWFVGCFSLIAYRLKSDDLELMEREVYEELQKKKEVERFLQKAKREDRLNDRSDRVNRSEESSSSSTRENSFDRELKTNTPDKHGL